MKTTQSIAPSQPLVMDGRIEDWQGTVRSVDEERFSLGLSNDENFLYLGFMSRDEEITRPIMGRGLMIWVDAGGGKDKRYGIRYPVGILESRAFSGERSRPRTTPGGAGADMEWIQARAAVMLEEIEMVSDEAAYPQAPALAESGIQASGSYDYGILTFEVRIPLHRTDSAKFAIDTTPGSEIAVGLELPEIDRDELSSRFPGREGTGRGGFGDAPGGGFGGAPSGGLGPGGAGGRGPRAMPTESPIDLWQKVLLATP